MLRTSEYVTIGHPDKVADFITSYVLDRYMEKDPGVRYAVEVQIKDSHVTLGGEVTSAYEMGDEELKRHVRDAICSIGYTPEYAKSWGAENCIDPDNLDIAVHIGRQSPDIAQGVNADGWGDQGIFWGMATSETAGMMPLDHALAKRIGDDLYEAAKSDPGFKLGLDIKTQVTIEDGKVEEIVVAVPTKGAEWYEGCGTPHFGDMVNRANLVRGIAEKALKDFGCESSNPNYIINGSVRPPRFGGRLRNDRQEARRRLLRRQLQDRRRRAVVEGPHQGRRDAQRLRQEEGRRVPEEAGRQGHGVLRHILLHRQARDTRRILRRKPAADIVGHRIAPRVGDHRGAGPEAARVRAALPRGVVRHACRRRRVRGFPKDCGGGRHR